MQEWFDENGKMAPYGENGFLFSVFALVLCFKDKELRRNNYIRIEMLCKKAFFYSKINDREFSDFPGSDEPWSEDNHIAINVFEKFMRDGWREEFGVHDIFFYKHWWRRWQIKHFIFFLYCCKWTRVFSYPLLPIMSLWFVGSCLNSKINKRAGVLDTDGKLLIFLILSVYDFPITKRLCNWAIKKNKRAGSWKVLFDIYYRDPNHPNRNFHPSAYEL